MSYLAYMKLFALCMLTAFTVSAGPVAHTEDVVYGRKFGLALTMDVFAPAQPNGAAVVFVVSATWRSSKSNVNPQSFAQLTDRGYTVFAVLLSSQPRFTMKEIVDDLPLALNYIQKNAARWNIAPNRIGFSGFSAGCHLALLHADKAKSVACFFPPTDFLNWGGPGLAPPKVLAEELGKDYSPLYRISAAHPPTLLIHGDADKLVPLQQSSTYIEQLKAQNVNAKLTVVPGKDHGWPTIFSDLNLVADWLDATLPKP